MCIVIPFILDVRYVDVPAAGSHSRRKVIQNFSTFLLRRLPQFFLREGFSRSFPSSTVKSNFVYQRFNRSPLVGHFFFFWGGGGGIPVCVTTPRFELTSQRQNVSRLPTEPPGLSALYYSNDRWCCARCVILTLRGQYDINVQDWQPYPVEYVVCDHT